MGWSEEESRSGEDSSPWPFWSLARAKPIKGLVEAPSVFKKKKFVLNVYVEPMKSFNTVNTN